MLTRWVSNEILHGFLSAANACEHYCLCMWQPLQLSDRQVFSLTNPVRRLTSRQSREGDWYSQITLKAKSTWFHCYSSQWITDLLQDGLYLSNILKHSKGSPNTWHRRQRSLEDRCANVKLSAPSSALQTVRPYASPWKNDQWRTHPVISERLLNTEKWAPTLLSPECQGRPRSPPLNLKGTVCLKSSQLIAGLVVMENHYHNIIAPGTLIRKVYLS